MRRGYEITPVVSEVYPTRLIVFDSEAYRGDRLGGVEIQTFRLAIAKYIELSDDLSIKTESVEICSSPEALASFIAWKARKDKTLYVYAHNLKYDLQLTGILQNLLVLGWKICGIVLQAPPTFITLVNGRQRIKLIDTFNYWQTSVDEMGVSLGYPKLTMPSERASYQDWVEYCKRDVEVLSLYLLEFMRFIKANDLGGLSLTLASQAFRAYRKRFMSCNIPLHSDERVLSLERCAYFGGRVEAYKIGVFSGEKFYKLDVNSMYPYVMKNKLYPYRFLAYSEDVQISKVEKLSFNYYILGEFEINTDIPMYPYPHYHKLIFPVGRFITHLHKPEIQAGLARGDLRVCKRLAIYEERDIFSNYVDYFYHLKLQAEEKGDKITRQMAKILLNSLYGKFGQRGFVSKIHPNHDSFDWGRITGYSESLGREIEINYYGDIIEIRYKHGEGYYSFPAIAGAVTAYARCYLWKLITMAGIDNVYYCDTDSLIVNFQGYAKLSSLLHPLILGYLKVEGETDYLEIFGAKDYMFGTKRIIKGVPKNAIPLGDNAWSYEQFRGIKTWQREGMPVNVTITSRLKERKNAYDKRIVLPDGSTSPIRF